MNEIDNEETTKQYVRDDLYWTLEGCLGSKAEARSILRQNFDTLYLLFGGTAELHAAIMKIAGITQGADGMWRA